MNRRWVGWGVRRWSFYCAAALLAALGGSAAIAADSLGAQVKSFVIAPQDGKQAFMCPAGVLESVSATAAMEYRPVSVLLLDREGRTIPENTWTQAAGFKLRRTQDVNVRVLMFCGP